MKNIKRMEDGRIRRLAHKMERGVEIDCGNGGRRAEEGGNLGQHGEREMVVG